MSVSLWGERAQPLQRRVALSNCLTVFFLPFIGPRIKGRADRAREKGLLILHYICVRHSEFKVEAVSKNKSHHKRLRYGETERGEKKKKRVREGCTFIRVDK